MVANDTRISDAYIIEGKLIIVYRINLSFFVLAMYKRCRGAKITVLKYSSEGKRPIKRKIWYRPVQQQSSFPLNGDNYVPFDNMNNEYVERSVESVLMNESVPSRHRKEKEGNEKQWREAREDLLKAAIQRKSPSSKICQECGKLCKNPVRCDDCQSCTILCIDCEKIVHKRCLHKPEIFLVSSIIVLSVKASVNSNINAEQVSANRIQMN